MSSSPMDASRRRLLLIVATVVAGIALLVAGVLIYLNRPAPTPEPIAPSVTSPRPEDAVRGYLDALIAGDAEAALSFAVAPPTGNPWLTDTALAASKKLGTWSVVSVTPTEGTGTLSVPVTLSYGGKEHQVSYTVVSTAGGWRLPTVTTELNLANFPPELSLVVDGSPIGTEAVLTVFPGVHQVTDGDPQITLGSDPVFASTVGGSVGVTADPTVSKAGQKELITLARESLAQCLKQRSLDPQGCPNVVTLPSGEVDPATISWSLKGDPWSKATFAVELSRPRVLEGRMKATFVLKAKVKDRKDVYLVDQEIGYRVVFTAPIGGDATTVTWQRAS